MLRWRLLQIVDSSFPTGGFAHSGGLEAAVHHGRARSSDEVEAYVGDYLWNVGYGSLPFVGAAFDAPGEVWVLDAHIDATLTSHVANRASRTQGRALLSTCSRVFDEPEVLALAARVRSRASADENVAAHLAPVFGACLEILGAERGETLALYLYVALRGVVSAAVRMGAVGPHEAQRLHRRLEGRLDDVLVECSELRPDSAASVAPILDIISATHDRLYARLFQS